VPAVPAPEFLTSRRHRIAGGAGLGVIAALVVAASFAPAPGVIAAQAAPVAQSRSVAATVDPDTAGGADVPTAGASATSPRSSSAPTATTTPTPNGPAITALAAQGIPIVALDAYHAAADRQAAARPSCHLSWTLVAAIGAVESGHGTHGGARLYADGQDLPHVIGPVLDGTAGNARIPDTDGGRYDGDKVFDRAVGPMQFIPSTWALRGLDGNGDGKADPFNIVDAAATTGDYLCRYDQDLGTDAGRRVAVFGYNHLDSYVATVLALEAAYAERPVTTTSPTPPAAPPSPSPSATAGAGPSPSRSTSPTPTSSALRPTPSTSSTSSTPATPTPSSSPTCPTASPTVTTTPSASPTASPTATPTGCPTASPTRSGPAASPSSSSAASSSSSAASSSSSSSASASSPSSDPTPTPSG
jgi:membrane-bound lytic murein transglycosylase B